jgi:hypothetical protein
MLSFSIPRFHKPFRLILTGNDIDGLRIYLKGPFIYLVSFHPSGRPLWSSYWKLCFSSLDKFIYFPNMETHFAEGTSSPCPDFFGRIHFFAGRVSYAGNENHLAKINCWSWIGTLDLFHFSTQNCRNGLKIHLNKIDKVLNCLSFESIIKFDWR